MKIHYWSRNCGALHVVKAAGKWVIERAYNNTITYFPATGYDWVPLYSVDTHGCLAMQFKDRNEASDYMFELLTARFRDYTASPELTRFWQHQAQLQEAAVA